MQPVELGACTGDVHQRQPPRRDAAGQIQQQYPTALISYEAGFKVDLFDRRLRLNGDVFLMDYSQRNGTFSGNEPRYDPNSTTLVIVPGNQTLIPDGPAGTDYADAFNNLAVVYLMTGRVPDAAAALERAKKSGYAVHPQLERDIRARLAH